MWRLFRKTSEQRILQSSVSEQLASKQLQLPLPASGNNA